MVQHVQDEAEQEATAKEAADLELARRLQHVEAGARSLASSGAQPPAPPTWASSPGTLATAHMPLFSASSCSAPYIALSGLHFEVRAHRILCYAVTQCSPILAAGLIS